MRMYSSSRSSAAIGRRDIRRGRHERPSNPVSRRFTRAISSAPRRRVLTYSYAGIFGPLSDAPALPAGHRVRPCSRSARDDAVKASIAEIPPSLLIAEISSIEGNAISSICNPRPAQSLHRPLEGFRYAFLRSLIS